MEIDWTFNAGHILTLFIALTGFAGTGVGIYFALKIAVTILAVKLDTFGGRLINVENDLKGIGQALVQVAVQDERMTNLEKRVDDMGRDNENHRRWTRDNIAHILRSQKLAPKEIEGP
jgi:hypothetical protein